MPQVFKAVTAGLALYVGHVRSAGQNGTKRWLARVPDHRFGSFIPCGFPLNGSTKQRALRRRRNCRRIDPSQDRNRHR
jgi:hypothetical protein